MVILADVQAFCLASHGQQHQPVAYPGLLMTFGLCPYCIIVRSDVLYSNDEKKATIQKPVQKF